MSYIIIIILVKHNTIDITLTQVFVMYYLYYLLIIINLDFAR